MQERRRFNQTAPLNQRLIEEAQSLRKEAQGTHPGIERERLIRRAREAETAAHMQEWLTSANLRSPTQN
jgi:predicted trehalose synthase